MGLVGLQCNFFFLLLFFSAVIQIKKKSSVVVTSCGLNLLALNPSISSLDVQIFEPLLPFLVFPTFFHYEYSPCLTL